MLAGLDARQLSEMYAFERIEPLDEPLQRMLAEIASTLARVHGNELSSDDFMLKKTAVSADQPTAVTADDKALRTQHIVQQFARASKRNSNIT